MFTIKHALLAEAQSKKCTMRGHEEGAGTTLLTNFLHIQCSAKITVQSPDPKSTVSRKPKRRLHTVHIRVQ